MAFTEDLASFFDTDDFAVTATVGASSITVIFDAAYVPVLGAESVSPAATVKQSDVAALAITQGTVLTINGTAYAVREVQPDGTGLAVLLLREGA